MSKNKINKRKILLSIFILLILLFICILYIQMNKQEREVVRVKEVNEYYNVETCVNKFYLFYKSIYTADNGSLTQEYKNEDTNASLNNLYDMLADDYIKKYNINTNNLSDYISPITSDEIQINDMYRIQKNENISVYIVYATQLYKNKSNEDDFNLVIKLDKKNNTFGIFLDNYIYDKGYDKLNIGDKINFKLSKVKKKNINIYEDSKVDIYDNNVRLFNQYQNNCMYYVSRAYSLLDEDCKKNKFSTYDSFEKYIKSNTLNIVLMKVISSTMTNRENYTEYKYLTDVGISFIIKEISPMKYTVIIE